MGFCQSQLIDLTAQRYTIDRSDEDKNDRKRHNEASLRTAAEYGHVKAVLRLLDDYGVDADAVEENTFLTALHHASMKYQLEVAQVLLERGASPSKADCLGKNRSSLLYRGGTMPLSLILLKTRSRCHRD